MSDLPVTTPILSLKNVQVGRGDFVLCQGVNLQLFAGDICHLIGENGLGKTTLLNQIGTLLPTYDGIITYQNTPVYVSHQIGISPALSVVQNLRFLLSLYGVDVSDDELDFALDKVGLYGLNDVSSAQLSAGQTRRIGLARLFLLQPAHSNFWLLDEPLTALDKDMVTRLEQRMSEFANHGGAVLATSHQTMHGATKTLDLTEFAV